MTCLTGLLLGARYFGDLGVKSTGLGALVLRLFCRLSYILEVVPSIGRKLEEYEVQELDPGRPSIEFLRFRWQLLNCDIQLPGGDVMKAKPLW